MRKQTIRTTISTISSLWISYKIRVLQYFYSVPVWFLRHTKRILCNFHLQYKETRGRKDITFQKWKQKEFSFERKKILERWYTECRTRGVVVLSGLFSLESSPLTPYMSPSLCVLPALCSCRMIYDLNKDGERRKISFWVAKIRALGFWGPPLTFLLVTAFILSSSYYFPLSSSFSFSRSLCYSHESTIMHLNYMFTLQLTVSTLWV